MACVGRRIYHWSMENGQTVRSLDIVDQEEPMPLSHISVAFSSDGRLAAVGPLDWGVMDVWDVFEQRKTLSLRGGSSVMNLAFSPDGGRVLICQDNLTLHLWDLAERRTTCKLDPWEGEMLVIAHDPHRYHLAFSPDGRRAVLTALDEVVLFALPK